MGVKYDIENQNFVFDFKHDGREDVISLTGKIHEVTAFGKCFYYGYEFGENVDGNVRTAFIKHLKFPERPLKENPDLTQFIQRAIDKLNDRINLYDYDLVVMPESSSEVNKYMIRYIYRFAQPMLKRMELVKALPENVAFDMEAYSESYLEDTLENGRPRYTEAQKEQVKQSVKEMLDLIHKKDYFTIAKDVKKAKWRPYITQFLRFANEDDRRLCDKIQNQNVLVIDDITTSGSTLNEVMRSLRIINESNNITIFSLIGRKDLMVESM